MNASDISNMTNRPFDERARPAFAGQECEYPREKSVTQLFEEVAAKYASQIAVVCGSKRLTYAGLNHAANRLAQHLREHAVTAGSMVGVCLERSERLIIAILGILKAGGAYVPLDPEYPRERIAFMLADTQTPLMVTDRAMAESILAEHSTPKIVLDDLLDDDVTFSAENPEPSAGPTSLAYVMYTSGSTGRPKGVLVEHRSIVRLVFNSNYCRFGPEQVFLHFAPISFDASTFEIWGALLHGSTLVVLPAKASSLSQIGQAIRENKVTTVWLTAGLFHLFVDERIEDLRSLKQLLAGGDVLSARHVRQVLEAVPRLTLINGYGPTEGTTFTSCHAMRHGDQIPDSVPIGKPVSNTFVYVLDENLKLVAPGREGELFAGGDGVARGYLNSPDLTAERFLPDPYSSNFNARMYRTGDRARWREDGTLEFLGRIDTQVKILGRRIELGEIEACLLHHPTVRRACVIAKSDEAGNKRLIAYCVPANRDLLSAQDLKDFLSSKLPAFMVPATYAPISELPLNANGKVDRSALPAPPATSKDVSFQRPSSNLEEMVSDVWKKVLQLDHVGSNDNFFDLGGDSLSIVAAHSQLQKVLEREIEITDLFEFTTIHALSQHLARNAPEDSVFSAVQHQAQRQREAFAKRRLTKDGMT